MVIEHSFVSSLPPEEIQRLAASFLAARGFARAYEKPDAERPDVLEMRRGADKAQKAKSITQLPQRIRLEYDRGRVVVAGLIEPSAVWGGSGSVAFSTGTVSARPKRMVVHEQLLRAMLLGLETLLAYNGTGVPDYAGWDVIENEADAMADARQRRIRNAWLTALGVVILCCVVIFVLEVITSRH